MSEHPRQRRKRRTLRLSHDISRRYVSSEKILDLSFTDLNFSCRKLTNIAIVLNFKHLLFVDVSGNFLTLDSLQVLSQMPYVIYIKAQRNRIESAALDPMPYLQVILSVPN